MASTAAAAVPRPPAAASKTKPMLFIDATSLTRQARPASNVPTILVTPPDAPPQYSTSIPEQQYEKSVLFVPVKTEELGWDEHGLYWNGTYAYPVHQIYNKEGQPIGRRRKGPHGYRFEEFYDNKKPRHTSSYTSSGSPEATSMAAADDTVEEAIVRLEEPAPQRIDRAAKSVVQQEHNDAPTLEAMEDSELFSPTSPTLSLTSDMAETEDSCSVCDDSSSLWSHNDAASDDGDSRCTSPGIMSPPMDMDSSAELQAETLTKKLSDLSSTEMVSRTSWLSLGTLPWSSSSLTASSSSSAASSRSYSVPVPRTSRAKPALEIEQPHRTTTCRMIVDASQAERRRHSSPLAFQSIITDLTTSPYAPCSASTPNTPYRSATLPRSASRSGYTASRSGYTSRKPGSLLRSPPQYALSRNTYQHVAPSPQPASTTRDWRSTTDPDFAAGWTFENASSALANHY
ncbi:uncharacterized protein UMAG_15083 [Mycosarcoma maydis]|uniref:Uncharacterized protein n=1 Tax=Mycosarcoma maydis TaxID=5270 RepID=A0A0D1E0G2_MYCMD|nr:uncharacterized protein UMAG_15083 [Ustilago maydis 521]KIS68215.1 hypothetical protein UMAG_15083 [Ustilago maydis 521]|eukprot:XP_011390363.1 hypothetical protein UMAG_15083 [Ustilago maydis 521]